MTETPATRCVCAADGDDVPGVHALNCPMNRPLGQPSVLKARVLSWRQRYLEDAIRFNRENATTRRATPRITRNGATK